MAFMDKLQQESSFSVASGNAYQYVVLQVTLKEKMFGTGSGNLTELENVINKQVAKGYCKLHKCYLEARDITEKECNKKTINYSYPFFSCFMYCWFYLPC